MIKILFQGDSITDGNRYKDPQKRWDLNHQIGHFYVFNIAGILGVKYPGKYDIILRKRCTGFYHGFGWMQQKTSYNIKFLSGEN